MDLYRAIVFPWQCDQLGHMNVMYYVHAFDQAFGYLLGEAGLTGAHMRETMMSFADVKHEIDYRAEQRAGDRIVVTGGFSKVGNSSAQLRLTMTNPDTGAVAATTTITSVHFDLAKRKSAPIPDDTRARIADLMVDG